MLEWPDSTLYQGIAAVAEGAPSRTALVFQGETLTFRDLVRESRALAAGLDAIGVEPGDTVAVWVRNQPAWVEAQLAASYLGAAVVAVNTRYKTHELAYLLEDAACRVLVTETAFLGTLADLCPDVRTATPETFAPESFPALERVLTVTPADEYGATRTLASVKRTPPAESESATDAEAPACIFYTSGTTSDPKGCLQSNRSLLNHSHQVGVYFDLSADDVALGALPFCGVFGYNTLVSALAHGVPLVAQAQFDPETALDLVETHGVTYFSAIGEMYRRLIAADGFTPERVETLSKGAVAFVNPGDGAAFRRIEDAVGFPLVQPYGLSEANSQVFVGDPDDPLERRQRVGGPLVFPEHEAARIVDPEDGEELPAGESGELCLRGVNVMDGYLGKPEKTEEAIVDGWLHTGDLAERDEDGYFYYHSRLDDALRVRGFLVTPRDVESAIDAHPDVEASQVVGAPHPRHGQVTVAFVKRRTPSLTEDALVTDLADRLADYKVPARVLFVESFPRTDGPHGRKIQKNELRDRVEDLFEEG